MGGRDDGGVDQPAAAFDLLSDGTRLDILRTLWAADAGALSFSEIRARMGSPDSGQFNYHLGQLTGHFVEERDGEYGLTQAGREIVRAVLAGTVTGRPAVDDVPVDGSCRECGGDLVARYDGFGIVECGACGTTVMWNEFPPAGVADRSPAAFARAFDRWTQARFRLAMAGVCPSCAGRTAMAPVVAADLEADEPTTVHRCETCKYEAQVPLFGHVLHHPAVVSFFDRHGVDVTAMPYWELRELGDAVDRELVETDPLRIRLAFTAGDEHLTLRLDEALAVHTVEAP